jgi:uncharacterized phage-like protein YoqJ
MDTSKITLGVTGHRELFHTQEEVYKFIETKFRELNPGKVLSGMALGFDTMVVDVCIAYSVPYIAVIPFEGQESRWGFKDQYRYYRFLDRATSVVIVDKGNTIYEKFNNRNEYIVDHSNRLLAYLVKDGRSGTRNCVEYANKLNKLVTYCI